MKVLLTGAPRSGKTTLLQDFILKIPNKQGFISREIRKNGEREGFELVSSEGDRAALAYVVSDSMVKVGRYGVEVAAFDTFLAKLPAIRPDAVLYIDEIGKMQLFSDSFKEIVKKYLDASNLFVGTIASIHADSFISEVLSHPEVVLLTVTPDNRSHIKNVLSGLALNIDLLRKLDETTCQKLISLSQNYAEAAQWVQLGKLWKNAIRYVAEDRLKQLSPVEFAIKGNTHDHKVFVRPEGMSCDCDLFNGKGMYAGSPSECSHIQTVKLLAK